MKNPWRTTAWFPAASGWPRSTGRGSRGPRRWLFPALVAGFIGCYLSRLSGIAPLAGVGDHLSNVFLSGLVVTLAGGPGAFTSGDGQDRALVAAVVAIAANLVLELGVAAIGIDDEVNDAPGDVNTSDPVDGLLGAAAALGVLALVKWPGGTPSR